MNTFLQFPDIPAPHAVTTRTGGHSPAPYKSLNLSYRTGDSSLCVRRNRSVLCHHMGLEPDDLCFARQVHGSRILHVTNQPLAAISETACDALVISRSDRAVGVLVADCLPILVSHGSGHAVAAVHAGRRGIETGIIQNTIAFFIEHLCIEPRLLFAGVGPGIGRDAYPVDTETATVFLQKTHPFGVADVLGNSKVLLDLRQTAHHILCHCGLPSNHIAHMRRCTRSHPESFYSHRGSGGVTGRFAAVIRPV